MARSPALQRSSPLGRARLHSWVIVINDLIKQEILSLRDDELWDEAVARETDHRERLRQTAAAMDAVE